VMVMTLASMILRRRVGIRGGRPMAAVFPASAFLLSAVARRARWICKGFYRTNSTKGETKKVQRLLTCAMKVQPLTDREEDYHTDE